MMALKLQDRTLRLIEQLEKADWFSKVGVEDIEEVTLLKSWDDAIVSCSTLDWENLTLESQNLVTERLAKHHQERYSLWNDRVNIVKEFTTPLIQEKTLDVMTIHNLPQSFLDNVSWDIGGSCILSEYADIYPSVFSDRIMQYYLAGHYPCGWDGPFPYGPDEEFPYSWEGDLPKGKFIIY